MPDEEKKTVPIDTSGPDATVDIEEVKDEVGCRNLKRRNKKQKQRIKKQIKHLKMKEKPS